MIQSRKRAVLTLIIWGSGMTAFTAIFFLGGGPGNYSMEKWRRILNGGLIAAGWVVYATMRYVTREKKIDSGPAADERDEAIGRRANETAFVAVLMYVFLIAIFLWEKYQSTGLVPVGWMWFLAYTTIFLGFITAAVVSLILDARMSRHGQS